MPEPTRPQPVTDPDFPDLIAIEGGPLIPCKVVQIEATTAPTRRVEGVGDLDATYEQTRQYVIRVRPKPVEVTYMAGVSDEEYQRARQAVLETALQIVDEQADKPARLPTVIVGQDPTPEHLLVVRAYRHAHGQPTVQDGPLRAAEVNQAVTWWNQQQEKQRD